MTFVDFAAAFDSVHRPSLWCALLAAGVPSKIVNILKNLYEGAKSRVKTEGGVSPEFEVTTGVRQGCIISPRLFIVIINWVARKARMPGVQVGKDFWMWYLAYADDLALFAESDDDAVNGLLALNECAGRLGLAINVSKTKVLGSNLLQLNNQPIEKVESFTYLGSKISDGTVSPLDEIRTRIGKATGTFARLRTSLWSRRNISIRTKMRIYRSAVLPVLLYGAETWRTLESDIRRLETFQMQCLRQIAGISLADHVRNEDIRELCLQQPTIAECISKSRLRWFGHASRMSMARFPRQMLTWGKPAGWKTSRNAPKKTWLSLVKQELDFMKPTYGARLWNTVVDGKEEWISLCRDIAEDRSQWRAVVHRSRETARPSEVNRRR